MGVVADMMLDGTLCFVCGEYLGEDSEYPITCAGCIAEETEEGESK